jgi:hypothetical protein
VDVEGNLWFSNVTRQDMSDEFLYACSAASYFRNEYKLGNRVFLQVCTVQYNSSPCKKFKFESMSFEIIRQKVWCSHYLYCRL